MKGGLVNASLAASRARGRAEHLRFGLANSFLSGSVGGAGAASDL